MAQKVTIILESTTQFEKIYITGRTLNNGMNPLKYGRIYIERILNKRKTTHGFTNETFNRNTSLPYYMSSLPKAAWSLPSLSE